MPEYAALFEYSNVQALENFVDYIAKLTADNSELLGQVSGVQLTFELFAHFFIWYLTNIQCMQTI